MNNEVSTNRLNLYQKEVITSFRDDLTDRQIELMDECATNNFDNEAFARACSEIFCESGMLIEEPEFLMIDEPGNRLDAICWPEEDQPIVEFLLFIRQTSQDYTELQHEITNAFEKIIPTLKRLCKPTGRHNVPESIETVVRRVLNLVPCPESILVRIITDASIENPTLESKLKSSLRRKLPDDINTDFKLCDIKDLFQNIDGGTKGPSEEFDLEGTAIVPCFLAHQMIDHDVYLASFPGKVLALAFRQHGQRLLQKNVRAFLGLKSKKNKNISKSLIETPQKFLAYNNGLTITVSNIVLNKAKNLLAKVDDMQIVNGGQTIAVLANAFKQNDPECLGSVMVAAKIIHVKNQDEHIRWIEKIAETSNTQNAIKDADLSSHNPVYLKIKELSNTTFFRKGAEQYKWYFSRVRNEYKAEIEQHKKRGLASLKMFENTYPKDYVIEKGLIARAECVFARKPWVASRGEAKCHLDFMENLPAEFTPDMEWYRNLIGKILLIRNVDKIAREVGVREGRSCIVDYACALFSFESDFNENIERIYRTQSSNETLDTKLKKHIIITRDQFAEFDSNRSTKEHAKREETWNIIKKAPRK
jgi:desulfoferrodoxin (superoxide reductase-like protein)